MLAWIDAYRLSTRDVTRHIELPIYFKDHFFYIFVGIKDAVFLFQNQSPRFQFDCVPPVVNVASRNLLGNLSAMLGHELEAIIRLVPPSGLIYDLLPF